MHRPVDLSRLATCSDGTADGLRRPDIELLAHRGGGARAVGGAMRLAELLRRIEALAHGGAAPGAAALMRDVTREPARVTVFLRGDLESAGAPRGAGL
jgi:hypothetical protein